MLKLPFKKLIIWQKGMALAKEVYMLTKQFPREEVYGLTSQMRRSATSIASNIAEGSQRKTNKDFRNFILVAKGSLAELETQLLLARELQYLSDDNGERVFEMIEELSKMLYAFSSKLTTDY